MPASPNFWGSAGEAVRGPGFAAILSGLQLVHFGETLLYLSVLRALKVTGGTVKFHQTFLAIAMAPATTMPYEMMAHNALVMIVTTAHLVRLIASVAAASTVQSASSSGGGRHISTMAILLSAGLWLGMVAWATRKLPWIQGATTGGGSGETMPDAQAAVDQADAALSALLAPHARWQGVIELIGLFVTIQSCWGRMSW